MNTEPHMQHTEAAEGMGEGQPGNSGSRNSEPGTPEQVMQAAAARLVELEAEASDMRDRWMRAEAETANVRARARRDVDEARQYAVQKFATDVVEGADNLRRGLDSLPPPASDEPAIVTRLREGFEGVERNFIALLERNGIKKSDPTGMLFDPNLHQAMSEQPSADHPPGTVLQAWTSAWTLNGRLLRPAMVVIAASQETARNQQARPQNLDETA